MKKKEKKKKLLLATTTTRNYIKLFLKKNFSGTSV
jgi:hypothetical protein